MGFSAIVVTDGDEAFFRVKVSGTHPVSIVPAICHLVVMTRIFEMRDHGCLARCHGLYAQLPPLRFFI